MNRILSFLLTLLILISSSLVILNNSAHAASPNALISLTPDKKYANITFTNIQNISKITYTLTYDTNGRNTGFEGLLRPKSKTSKLSRKQILGTCSTRRCVFHKSPKNFNLFITFTNNQGKSTTLTKTL